MYKYICMYCFDLSLFSHMYKHIIMVQDNVQTMLNEESFFYINNVYVCLERSILFRTYPNV